MTDDIVSQLRMPLPWNLAGMTTKQLGDERRDAADEIERLTADRDRWRSLAERAMDLLDEANKVLATIQEAIKND